MKVLSGMGSRPLPQELMVWPSAFFTKRLCNTSTSMDWTARSHSANLCGPGDHYDERSHVVAALIRRFVEANHEG